MVEALVGQGDVNEANSSDFDCVGEAITAAEAGGAIVSRSATPCGDRGLEATTLLCGQYI